MIISRLHIQNFRALKDVTFDMSSFSCIIGENNAGKSSLLHALHRFIDGTRLLDTDYYEPSAPVRIQANLRIAESELQRLKIEEQRSRIKSLISSDGILQITRVFNLGQKGDFRCTRRIPKEERWQDDVIDENLKGKKDAELRSFVNSDYPEVSTELRSKLTQKDVREALIRKRDSLSLDWVDNADAPLPTGIDNSIISLLPEPIYIEAVKDIAGDMKTKDSAVFGKLLSLLLNVIQPQLDDIRGALEDLDKKLNIFTDESGKSIDNRIEHIREVEALVQQNLQDNFPAATVSIKIPPPEIKTILQSARMDIGDGAIAGPVETKGDGLKRSVLFSLFRAYVQLSSKSGWNPKAVVEQPPHYIILFEEPELYLHPTAQQVLFDSLAQVAQDFQVIVTTHSPLFFSAKKTKTFAKISKKQVEREKAPFSELMTVDLEKDFTAKDEFQLLCYENNNVAFFANSVLLVEGGSDVAALKHLACTLNPVWDFEKGKVHMVKVGGKGNFARYIDFFKRFKIDVLVLADLDALVSEFDKLRLRKDSPCNQARDALFGKVEKLVTPSEVGRDDAKEIWKDRGPRIFQIIEKCSDSGRASKEDVDFLNDCTERGQEGAKVKILKDEASVQDDKKSLLRDLRAEGIMILDRGSLEDYYPVSVTGSDKTTKADSFRKMISTHEEALRLAKDVPTSDGKVRNEFEAIFARVFEDTDAIRP